MADPIRIGDLLDEVSNEVAAAMRRHPSGRRREPTVGELGLCGSSDDDGLGPDAARWRPEGTS